MARKLHRFLRLVLLASLSLPSVCAVGGNQCGADLATSCGSEAGHNQFTRYDNFEDIPQDIVERAHLRALGSHRAAEDCAVEALPYMISSEDFYERYVVRHKPVVLKNTAKHWPATKLWTDEYLKENYGDIALNVETTDNGKSPIPPAGTVREFLEVYKTTKLRIADQIPPGMRRDIVWPECLRCNVIAERIFALHFRMSHSAMSSHLHIHTDNSLLTAVQGNMDVVLVSPKYSRDVYADEASVLGVSEVNVSAVDLEKFPRVSNIHYSAAHLEAGDSIYLPKMWWYWVHSPAVRQQAILIKWKSAPLANMHYSSSRKEGGSDEMASASVLLSYSKWLVEYAKWMESERSRHVDVMQSECRNQVQLMSETSFDTDKAEWREELAAGRRRTAEPTQNLEEIAERGKESMRRLLDDEDDEDGHGIDDEEPHDSDAGGWCIFDFKNSESPCHSQYCNEDIDTAGIAYAGLHIDKSCEEMLDDTTGRQAEEVHLLQSACCLKTVLNYCKRFEDRACVVEIPGLLNKLTNANIKVLEALKVRRH